MQQGPVPNMSGLAKTMVVSGLGGLGSLQAAAKRLNQKLAESNAPRPVETYMKSADFNGLLFAKYRSMYGRDVAVVTFAQCKVEV